jgi:hypothetical protein
MNEKSDNKYNINIFNISYGLQENLGKKLESKIQGITDRKDINKVFIDSSDISVEDSNMNYYEQLLESIKGESNNDVHTKSRNTSPAHAIKKSTTSKKKNFYQKEFKKRLMEQQDSSNKNNENLLCLHQNKEISLEHAHSNQTDSSHKNYHSHIFEQNNIIKHKLNSSSKIFEEDEISHVKENDKTPIKYSIHDISKFSNNLNLFNHDIQTPKSEKHFSKHKKGPRHSTFLIDEGNKKEKRKKSSIFYEDKNYSNNNIEKEQVKNKKNLKLKKNDGSKKNLKIESTVVGLNDKQYNNNFVSTINTSNVNTIKIKNKKKYFLCCIPIS